MEDVTKSFPSSCSPASSLNFHAVKKSSKTLGLSLHDTFTIQRRIAKELGIENIGSLVFLGANKGCIELKFSVPNVLLDRVKQQHNANSLTELPGLTTLETEGINILCGPPGKPYAIAVTSSSINLQWSKPEYQGSHPIQHYCVLYKSLHGPLAKWRVIQSKALDETLEIRRLSQHDMPFIFKVQAVNNIGAGVLSEDSDPIDLTRQSLMISENIPCKPDKPGRPKAITITDNSIQLEWTKPENGVEIITSYTILYRSQFNDPPNHWTEIRAASTKERVVVSQLSENTTYLFQVLPECEDGVGLESDVSNPITTKMIIPSKPGKPQVINATHYSIQLEWTKPKEGSHNISSYTILYRSASDPSGQWILWKTEVAEEKATLTQLSEKTEYYFKVMPRYKEGFGIESDISEPIFTRASKPGISEALKASIGERENIRLIVCMVWEL